MESVVKDFSRTTKLSNSPSNSLKNEVYPNVINSMEAASLEYRASGLVFEDNETTSMWDPPMSINGSLGSTDAEPLNHADVTELEVEYTGSFCVFSPTGIWWVNNLVEDNLFGREVSTLALSSRPRDHCDKRITFTHPLPNRDATIICANEYFAALNRDMPLFDKQELMDGIERFYSTGISPSRGWYVAINIILAHVFQTKSETKDSIEAKKYMGNAMITLFHLGSEKYSAVMLLSTAVQLMVLGGYNIPCRRSRQTELQKLRERRLFWQAVIFDHDLSLRIRKPPMIGPDFTIDLPEERPSGGFGTLTFEGGGITLNFLREQVILAKTQRKVYSSLYSKEAKKKQIHDEIQLISDLDSELCAWKSRIPEITKSTKAPFFDKDPGVISLTVLHCTYYQLVIVFHSFIFQSSNLDQLRDDFDRIHSSVALCVGAARARISLLNFHEDSHMFSLHLLNNVSWSLDVVFINILQNKGTPGARKDLNLLGRIISRFKKFDPNYRDAVAFRTASLFQVACRALQNYANSQNPAPNHINRPDSWHRYDEQKTIPPYPEVPNETEPPMPTYPQQCSIVDTAINDNITLNGNLHTMQDFPPDLPLGRDFALPTDEQFFNLRLDNPIPMITHGSLNNDMMWTDEQQIGPDGQWRLASGSAVLAGTLDGLTG
ncbi:hypothetical protein BKA61DRAFT_721830 [Leptodontidium sp. MPI-SDFR-AT-0119]|nr:hypothetical protein BKA61DRAFT_721830 [Leptodontidium sp. MPI-SDFR-AT-0119]